jgi:phosphoserine phosphatase RsbX
MAMKEACLDWAAAAAVLSGQTESGDRHYVRCRSGSAMVAAVDGLGHGAEAAAAARTAIDALEEYADESLVELLRRCHECLRPTRGAVISLASINFRDDMLTWLGVGNVAGFLLRADRGLPTETLLLRSGVVGDHLPPLQTAELRVVPGDVLVFATDGVRADFAESIVVNGSLQTNADQILANYDKGTDDALVLMARYGRSAK